MNTLKVSEVIQGRDEVRRFSGTYRFEDLPSEGDIVCDWEVAREIAGFSVRGDLHANLTPDCVRCLQPFPLRIDLQFNERYVLSRYTDPYEREKQLGADDFFETIDEDEALDLADLVHQLLILECAERQTCGRAECRFQQVGTSGE